MTFKNMTKTDTKSATTTKEIVSDRKPLTFVSVNKMPEGIYTIVQPIMGMSQYGFWCGAITDTTDDDGNSVVIKAPNTNQAENWAGVFTLLSDPVLTITVLADGDTGHKKVVFTTAVFTD